MIWKDFSRNFKDGDHAFLSPSTHSWYNYDEDKLIKVYMNKLAASRGTAMHALACSLIRLKVKLPKLKKTLNLYVNDAIKFGLNPEYKLYYSKFCYGTADAIGFENWHLEIADLKTGKTKVSFLQLRIYAALFFLCYPEFELKNVKGITLRIYQNDEVLIENPEIDEILPIMDKIIRYTKILQLMEDEYDENFSSHRSGAR